MTPGVDAATADVGVGGVTSGVDVVTGVVDAGVVTLVDMGAGGAGSGEISSSA